MQAETSAKRWRGIVKARHLVLAIHDYFLQKIEDQRRDTRVDGVTAQRISENDIWTLEFVDLAHLQPILEALDGDASGYVTVQEVNHFTTSRPQGWRFVVVVLILVQVIQHLPV